MRKMLVRVFLAEQRRVVGSGSVVEEVLEAVGFSDGLRLDLWRGFSLVFGWSSVVLRRSGG